MHTHTYTYPTTYMYADRPRAVRCRRHRLNVALIACRHAEAGSSAAAGREQGEDRPSAAGGEAFRLYMAS